MPKNCRCWKFVVISAVALSELARQLFLRFSREFDLTPQELGAFSFLFTSVGASIGTFLYGVYHDISASQRACEQAIQEFKQLISREPGISYHHAEPSFWFSPLWFSVSSSVRLRWGTLRQTYQTDCTLAPGFSGEQGIAACTAPIRLPLMLGD